MSEHRDLFDGNLHISLKTAASLLAAYPASARAFKRLSSSMQKAKARRAQLAREGTEVPPLLIVSTTNACNLSCTGCYACAAGRDGADELTDGRIAEILDEASALGVSVVMLAGGEPMLSHGWLDSLATHPELAGLVFTNGTLLDDMHIAWFSEYRHILPTLSIEGNAQQTDQRRGTGIHAKVEDAMQRLKRQGIPFGVSITATSRNMDDILADAFTQALFDKGCRLFVYVEYVPTVPGSEPLVLSLQDKRRLNEASERSRRKHPALFIPFPGNEEQYGGCLAAGRGFVHIGTAGEVEPCPFAPFSDTSLKHTTLKNALSSPFLLNIRRQHHLLKEGEGGCALWQNRERLAEMK